MSEFTNRSGVNLVERAALRLGWLFREQSISDQGIDAHVEKATNEDGTGRLIAIQIKTGKSYFNKPSEDGWFFPFNAKKARLWLNHALPVVVVLVDLSTEQAYWQVISNRTIMSTGKNFKVDVPRHHKVADADVEWTYLASGLESRAVELFEFALTKVPPTVREKLTEDPTADVTDRAVLALHLAKGRNNASGTVSSLLATSPGWMLRLAPASWQALASYAAEHDLPALSAEALERAASAHPARRGRLLAAAAINVLNEDRLRARVLLDEAKKTVESDLTVLVAETLLGHPEDDAGPFDIDQRFLAGSAEVRTSCSVQTLLSEHRARSGDPNGACYHARLALEAEPENTTAMLVLAVACLRRSSSNHRQISDLPDSIRILESALTQRRTWSGATIPFLIHLIRAYGLDGQYAKALMLCAPPPVGSASDEEAADPRIRRQALYAAWAAGRRELLPELSSRLSRTVEDKVAKLRTGTLKLSAPKQEALWLAEIDRASKDDDYEAILKASVALASLGVDERERLVPLVRSSILPATYIELIDALLKARLSLDAALPSLRSLSRRDSVTAEFLIGMLTEAGRHGEAAENCAAIYAHTKDPYLLIARAQCLIRIESSEAESAARIALGASAGFPEERSELFRFLGIAAANRSEWDAAESDFISVLSCRPKPSTADAWNLVLSQVNQGQLRRAANTIAEHQPVVRTSEDAQLWLRANSATHWDEAKVSEALALARRIKDPKISTALLGQIVMRTRGVDAQEAKSTSSLPDPNVVGEDDLELRRRLAQPAVPAELHRQAFSAMQELTQEFGESTGFSVYSGDPKHLAEQMLEISRQREVASQEFRQVVRSAQEAGAPHGFIASMLGKSHAAVLVQRALGPLIAGAADDAEHEIDTATATKAVGTTVVVDAATLLSLTALRSPAYLEGQFSLLQMSTGTAYEIHAAGFEIRSLAGSPGTFGWDLTTDSAVFWELPEEEYIRQLRRVQAVEDLAERISIRPIRNGMTLFDIIATDKFSLAWLEPIQLAYDHGVSLWSDDVGLRRLAREFGVPCFGTPALIDSLRDSDLAGSASKEPIANALERTVMANRELALDFVADVALHLEDLIWLAERDAWQPRSAGVVLSRPSWWAWQVTPMIDLVRFYGKVQENNPESLPEWQNYVFAGIAKAYAGADPACRVLANVALMGFGGVFSMDVVVAGIKRARAIAKELGLSDPLLQIPAAVGTLSTVGHIPNLDVLADTILGHFDVLNDPED